jgi:hypothetical protein
MWLEATDPGSGKLYYYHSVTKETRWDKPVETKQNASAAAIAGEWLTSVDPTTGRSFMYNSVTWEQRAIDTSGTGMGYTGSSNASESANARSWIEDVMLGQTETDETVADTVADLEDLPPGEVHAHARGEAEYDLLQQQQQAAVMFDNEGRFQQILQLLKYKGTGPDVYRQWLGWYAHIF